MNNKKILTIALLIQFMFVFGATAQSINTLTPEEKNEGWRLLFDGKTFNGWNNLTNSGWEIKDGELSAVASNDHKQRDIITVDQFVDFEFYFEFKISEGTNSGIKYLVLNEYVGQKGTYLGLEYQILDDKNFKYPERAIFRSSSSLYDLIPADNKKQKPLGQWNVARVMVNGNHVEHWLNELKVLEYNRSTDAFKSLIQQSKYKDLQNFGKNTAGHLLLQNEGTPISFRNIKIKSN